MTREVGVGGDRDAVMSRMTGLLVKILRVRAEEVRLESRLTTDLRADSLDLATLAVEIEDEFQVKVSEPEVQMIQTVKEAIEFVCMRQQRG